MGLIEKIPRWMLQEWQAQPLDWKIQRTLQRIKEFYKANDEKVYVSFSGGKDSTVLLNLVRSLYPEVPGVYVNTGLEYPEINEFVKTVDNIVELRPKKSFVQVIEDYGYPVVSKEISLAISRYRTTPDFIFPSNPPICIIKRLKRFFDRLQVCHE